MRGDKYGNGVCRCTEKRQGASRGRKTGAGDCFSYAFSRADTEQWRKNMIEVQATIRAIDEALKDEEDLAST
jgi:hypothetical protein